MTTGAIQRMRPQADVEVQVACPAAIEPLATLARQTQTLTIDRARRDTRLDVVRHTPDCSARAVLGHRQLQAQRHPVKGVLEADLRGHLEILAGHRAIATGERAATARA